MTRLNLNLIGFFRRNYPMVCVCLVLSNFVLSCASWRSVTPQYVYSTVTNVVERVTVVTQLQERVEGERKKGLLQPPSQSDLYRPKDYPCNDYLYFVADGRKCVRLWGRVYLSGSLTSRGRILDVFPDRVVLEGGDSILNTKAQGSYNERSTDNPIAR